MDIAQQQAQRSTEALQSRFNYGRALYQQGNLPDAERVCEEVLAQQSNHFDALHLLGVIAVQTRRMERGVELFRKAIGLNEGAAGAHNNLGYALTSLRRPEEALASLNRAIALDPNYATAYNNLGNALLDLGRLEAALASYDRAIELMPDNAEAHSNRGNAMKELNRLEEALANYNKAIVLKPDFAEAYNNRGVALRILKRFEESLASCDMAIAREPDYAEAYRQRGNALLELQHPEQALASYHKAIGLLPNNAEAHNNAGVALLVLKRPEEALTNCNQAIALKPNYAEAYSNRGLALFDLKHSDQALASYDKAIALKPNFAQAYYNRGNVLLSLRRPQEALASHDRAIALNPDYAEAYGNRGLVLQELKRPEEAVASYDKAITLKPDDAEAYHNRGYALLELHRHEAAVASFDKAIALKPASNYAEGSRIFAKLQICDWENQDSEVSQLLLATRKPAPVSFPFPLLAIPSSPADQLLCTKSFVKDQLTFPKIWQGNRYSHDRIRIAYVSADFQEHPVAYLIAGLFELHDKARFELMAISFGSDQNSDYRHRIERAFDTFIDARSQSDQEIADLILRAEIDIAVDLMGFTKNMRPRILGLRPAPIQVNYLGFPGTMGAPYIDYIIADRVVIPESQYQWYAEKVVSLPESYQVNDEKRAIANRVFTRTEMGLPATGFVYTCFNNSYKITPRIFESWMRILRNVEGSVLWLYETNATAALNLRKEAIARGIEPERLVFAKGMPPFEHLARLRLADLFLDTLPYNAHTTASDALWSGLPVLTCLGDTFAGRVAASLLHAINLPELITTTLDDYETAAVRLATKPEQLAIIKRKLAENRLTTSLFDTKRFTRNIEAAYSTMYQRHHAGLAPDHIVI